MARSGWSARAAACPRGTAPVRRPRSRPSSWAASPGGTRSPGTSRRWRRSPRSSSPCPDLVGVGEDQGLLHGEDALARVEPDLGDRIGTVQLAALEKHHPRRDRLPGSEPDLAVHVVNGWAPAVAGLLDDLRDLGHGATSWGRGVQSLSASTSALQRSSSAQFHGYEVVPSSSGFSLGGLTFSAYS